MLSKNTLSRVLTRICISSSMVAVSIIPTNGAESMDSGTSNLSLEIGNSINRGKSYSCIHSLNFSGYVKIYSILVPSGISFIIISFKTIFLCSTYVYLFKKNYLNFNFRRILPMDFFVFNINKRIFEGKKYLFIALLLSFK